MATINWLKGGNKALSLASSEDMAIRLDSKDRIVDSSTSGQTLVDLWETNTEILRSLVIAARRNSTVSSKRFKPTGTSQTFWFVAVPEGHDILIIARDMTVQDKVTEALLSSRDMFREMLSDAVDFAWEVDMLGRFIYVGPRDVMGVKAETLLGHYSQDFFWPDGGMPSRNPFKMTEEFHTKPIRIKLGSVYYWIKFAGKPIFDKESGGQIGVRGVGIEVTDVVEGANKKKQDALRLSLLSQITNVIHEATGSQELLVNAAEIMARVLRSEHCWIVLEDFRGISVIADEGEGIASLDMTSFATALARSDSNYFTPASLFVGDNEMLVVRLSKGGQSKGLLILRRDTAIFPWSEQEHALLEDVSDSLAVALEQANLIDKLHNLSYRDELTGLMNRRAFDDVVSENLAQKIDNGGTGTLMYVDLDYFKQVNDTLGHEKGDLALRMVADVLAHSVRAHDCVGRIGGDEFLVWLDGADATLATQKADQMLGDMANVRRALDKTEQIKLSLSIGIVEAKIDKDTTLQKLMTIADRAMYGAKEAGKSGYVVANS